MGSGVVKLEEEVKCEEPAPKKRAVMTKLLASNSMKGLHIHVLLNRSQ